MSLENALFSFARPSKLKVPVCGNSLRAPHPALQTRTICLKLQRTGAALRWKQILDQWPTGDSGRCNTFMIMWEVWKQQPGSVNQCFCIFFIFPNSFLSSGWPPLIHQNFSSRSASELGLVALANGQIQKDLFTASWDGIGTHVAVQPLCLDKRSKRRDLCSLPILSFFFWGEEVFDILGF